LFLTELFGEEQDYSAILAVGEKILRIGPRSSTVHSPFATRRNATVPAAC